MFHGGEGRLQMWWMLFHFSWEMGPFFSIFSSLSWTSLYIQVPFPSSLILGGNWPHLTSVVDIQFKFIVGVRVVWYWLLRCCNLLLAFWAFARDICFSHYFNFWINRISYQVEILTLMNLISETFPIFCYHPACLSATELFSDFLFGHAVAVIHLCDFLWKE